MRLASRSWTRFPKKLALSAVVFVLGLLACELGFRGWLRLRGEPYDATVVAREVRDAADPIAVYLPRPNRQEHVDAGGKPIGVLHPFAGAENEHDSGGVLQYFREGVPENEYTVVVMGGSVAAFFAVSGAADLEHALSADPRLGGRTARVLNYAHAAYKQPQQLMRLAYLLSTGYRPDAVINLDGFNEIALGYENGLTATHPLYPSSPVWGVLVRDFGAPVPEQLDLMLEMWQLRNRMRDLVGTALSWRLYRSALAGRFVESRVLALSDERFRVQQRLNRVTAQAPPGSQASRQMNGPDYERDEDAVLELCARNWFESSLSIQALCDMRGIAYLHILQPTFHDPGSKPLSPVELALPPGPELWKPAVLGGYPKLRARAAELASHGVCFLDASRAFADVHETLYSDTCHFGAPGNKILVKLIAPYFLDQLAQRKASAGVHAAPMQSAAEKR